MKNETDINNHYFKGDFEMIEIVNRRKHLCLLGMKVFFILVLSGSCALPAYTQENSWKELNDKTISLLQKKMFLQSNTITNL